MMNTLCEIGKILFEGSPWRLQPLEISRLTVAMALKSPFESMALKFSRACYVTSLSPTRIFSFQRHRHLLHMRTASSSSISCEAGLQPCPQETCAKDANQRDMETSDSHEIPHPHEAFTTNLLSEHRAFTVLLLSLGLALGSAEAAVALGPEGPLVEEFWDNMRRYGLYFLTVFSGGLYTLLEPIIALLKNPFTAIFTIAFLSGSFYLLYLILNAMLGITDFV